MLNNEDPYVALFVDWDNLAISVAAEMAGAAPDLRRIVQKAQQYGSVLLARAYAEWQVTSEKLAVYRCGVEPVYAPTFRFESDSSSGGKSLADPCMVADIVDSLHLLPQISTLIIVTGDKDMVPVVRLAQLRGKKVVVVGPDLVAGVLRDMADEFVLYRRLLERELDRGETQPRGRVAFSAGTRASVEGGTAEPAAAARHTVGREATRPRSRVTPMAVPIRRGNGYPEVSTADREQATPGAPGPSARDQLGTPAAAGGPGLASPPSSQPVPGSDQVVTPADLPTVLAAMRELLRLRAAQGKPRVRATNLKDGLLRSIESFNERRLGFSKFKDLLAAAETAGILKVHVIGAVHWVSLPDRETQEEPSAAAAPEATVDDAVELTGDQLAETLRFVMSLRDRSRWLTYTYLLTNVISRFSGSGPAAAEARARAVLNEMVQQGMLVVDSEPREIEVAGTRHRVRLCHLQDDHPLVMQALSEMTAQLEAAPAEILGVPESEVQDEEAASDVPSSQDGATESSFVEAAAAPESEEVRPARRHPRSRATRGAKTTAPADSEAAPADTAVKLELLEQPDAEPIEPPLETVPSTDGVQQADGHEQPPADQSAPVDQTAEKPSLDDALATLAHIVSDSMAAGRARIGAASAKARLVRSLGDFSERTYGFSRFKDFLLQAERRGLVRLEHEGQVTWVSPAAEPEVASLAEAAVGPQER